MVELVNKPKILVVDDLPANLLSMKALLKKVDVDIITADSGNDALSIALQYNFALILLDVNMPGMDGFEVASFLSGVEETKHIPIIFVTAIHHDEASVIKAYDSGAVDYVEKPIMPEILISKVSSFVDLWTLRHGLELEVNLRKRAEKEIEYLDQHDSLTQLANRRKLNLQLSSLLDRAARSNEHLAVLFLNLDGFKKINDQLGHEAGDAVLVEIASRFKNQIRSFDVLARYGGDEFIIVLSNISASLMLTSRLRKIIEQVANPVVWEKNEVSIGVSIGIAIYPDHGETVDMLVTHADSAMYHAKKEGKNNFKFFSDQLNQQMQRCLEIEKQLANALVKEELSVYLQPLVDVETGKLVGAEALLRWHNDVLGMVTPDEFIPVAEDSGHIFTMGVWVLQQILPVLKRWPQIRIAINASSLQFKNSMLYDEIQLFILQNQLQAKNLEVEITESLLLDNSETVKHHLQQIRGLGVAFSIDDFGTGYSSLSYLKHCPISTLKIDRSFIAEIPENNENCALVKAIIAMAHALNLNVIAEGVETTEQLAFLEEYKCDLAQGYLFSRPMNIQRFEEYLVTQLEGGPQKEL